jgi:hypothetical protein
MATINLHTRGSVPVLFTDVTTGNPVDPTTVRLKIQPPTLGITTYTHPNAQITKNGTGDYTTSILFNRPGKWRVFWQGESSNEITEEIEVHVNGSAFYDSTGAAIPDS